MYECLHDAIESQNCQKALSTFLKFYNQESSKINIPRTNIISERAVKKIQEIIENSRSKKYLAANFLLSTIFNQFENYLIKIKSLSLFFTRKIVYEIL